MSGFDFVELRHRYEKLPNGPKADLRRLTHPDKAAEVAVGYRLMPGVELKPSLRRVLFCLPWVRHGKGALGAALSKAGVDEKRLFQIVRSESPNDVIQLRRLLQWSDPIVDWADFGKQLFFWNDLSKRRLLENYYLTENQAARN